MHSLTRDQLLAATQLPPPVVRDVPGVGPLSFRTLSADERLEWELEYIKSGSADMRSYNFGLLARSVVDAEGKPMLTMDEWAARSDTTVKAITLVAAEVNGIGVKAVAAAEGKSEAMPASDGAGSLPGDSGTHTPT